MNTLATVQELYADMMVTIVKEINGTNDIELVTMYKQLVNSTDPFHRQIFEIVKNTITQKMNKEPHSQPLFKLRIENSPAPSITVKKRLMKKINHNGYKLQESDVKEIMAFINAGETVTEISKCYKVSEQTIRNIVNKKTWKNVGN